MFDFESQFKGAIRQQYEHLPIVLEHVLVVTDVDDDKAREIQATVSGFLGGLCKADVASWQLLTRDTLGTLPGLLTKIEEDEPDLVVTYRNLLEVNRDSRYSLGTWADTLTQVADVPVLLLPVRRSEDVTRERIRKRLADTDRVMVVTDHLTEDAQLVRWGAELTRPGGTLFITHIEEQAVFDRYIDVISRIPELDTDVARRTVHDRLLKEPADFCHTVELELREHLDLSLRAIVEMAPALERYEEILNEHAIDLLVADSKDPTRRAMSALTAALAVEFREHTFLLL